MLKVSRARQTHAHACAAMLLAFATMTAAPVQLKAQRSAPGTNDATNDATNDPTNDATNDAVKRVLLQYAVRPVVPPSPATDLTLPALGGGEVALSNSRGRWLLVTFFATWCGPCAMEMPSVQRVFEQRRAAGVDVIAVATDQDPRVVEPYARQNGLTLPILLDSGGQAAAIYRAQSIPVSYLIDPQGRIVGVARGARDWTATGGLFDALLKLVPPSPDAVSAYAQAGSAVELPPGLEPPSAEVRVIGDEPRAGRAFALEVRVRWAGNFDDYVLMPPKVHTPEGVSVRATSASSSSTDGSDVVTYRIELVAAKPGVYALDPVDVRYTPRVEASVQMRRITGPTVTVATITWLGMRPWLATAVMAGLLAMVAAAGAWWRRRRARQARTQSEHAVGAAGAAGETYGTSALRAAFERARSMRVEGRLGACVVQLAELDAKLHATEQRQDAAAVFDDAATAARRAAYDSQRATLLQWVERVRFGGYTPPHAEIDRLQRELERRLTALAPDPGRQEQESLQLADGC